MSKSDPLEKTIELKVCKYAESLGFIQYKFTSPQRRSVPDRIFITPSGVTFFIEFKRLGKKPTDGQKREIDKMRAQGVDVFVIDDTFVGMLCIDMMNTGVSEPSRFGGIY